MQKKSSIFHFRQFQVRQEHSAMKIGTDAMVFGALVPAEAKFFALDIGTGTGVLSLMLAQKNPKLRIIALELDPDAATEASGNILHSKFSGQIQVVQGDFLEFQSTEKFDLIISNPPFFENSSRSENEQKNRARHTDSLPLKELILKGEKLLSDSGDFWLVLPAKTADQLQSEIQKTSLVLTEEICVFGKPGNLNRKIMCFSKQHIGLKKSGILIRDEEGNYTQDYINLTESFHGKKL